MSPDEILSPIFLLQETTFPSVIVDDSAGIMTDSNLSDDNAGEAGAAAVVSLTGAALTGAATAATGAELAAGGVLEILAISATFSTMTATVAPTAAESPSAV